MIDYKSASESDSLIASSPANFESPISLTSLWEIIVRTKRLPDQLEPRVLFILLRERLRNVEREVRQHALRVLADLIPVIERNQIDKHMEFILPDLIVNLSHLAPAVRKGTVDVLRIYVKYSAQPNDVVRSLMSIVPDDSQLMQGLLMAAPYFTNHHINENTLDFLIRQLFSTIKYDYLKETSVCSLVKIRNKLGVEHFNNLLGSERIKTFQELCKDLNIILSKSDENNVILETEITLNSGPAITMKIHEEIETSSMASNQYSEYIDDHILQRHDADSISRSPRKVHFGGEVVKMRTPESDSNVNSSDDNDVQTAVIIDRPTSIKITLSDSIAAIKTHHKSLIPVRVTTVNSTPTTPRKKIRSTKRHHKSAPELGSLEKSKIPLPASKKRLLIEKKVRSRGEDQFSPTPIHEEIEVFHNLTRSPRREKPNLDPNHSEMEASLTSEASDKSTTYPSFQIYKDEDRNDSLSIKKDTAVSKDTKSNLEEERLLPDSIAKSNTYPSFAVYKEDIKIESAEEHSTTFPLAVIVHDLIHKEDAWNKSRSLDDLVAILRQNSINLEAIPISQLLDVLFLCEKQFRLQTRAQEILHLVISKIGLDLFQELYNKLCNGVVRVKAPSGVKLCLLVMQRSSPRNFFENLKIEPSIREPALQVLIAAARTFPSSEIDLLRGINLAFDALKDNKRAVRQAALEALATLAQVAGNVLILEAINRMVDQADDDDYDQLLNVVRTRLSRRQLPTVDLDGNIRYSSPREQQEFDWLCGGVATLSKSTSLSSIKVPAANYWKRNLRHDLDSPAAKNLDNSSNKEQVWKIDGTTFPKIETAHVEKAHLYPVYVLHRETPQVNGKSYRNYDRGRSNSPPPSRHNANNFRDNFENSDANRRNKYYKPSDPFRKSFSSEQLYSNKNVNKSEATSYSLSSRSSTTSTGSSTRSGVWFREFRSGIPVPIAADTKLRFRSNRNSSENYNGPLIVQESIDRTKVEASSQNTPVIKRSSPQVFTQPIPPPSSGSESSGYFTPPAEHHLVQEVDNFTSNEAFEEKNDFSVINDNFQVVVDSEASESHETDEVEAMRQSSVSSVEITERLNGGSFEEAASIEETEEKPYSPIDEVDFGKNLPSFAELRSKSRSETNLKNALPEITERKNINSAPPIADLITVVPYSFGEPTNLTATNMSLPGFVASTDSTPTRKLSEPSPKPRRLIRRSLSVRTASVKRGSKSPKASESNCLTRPKELLHQCLIQMENLEWEVVMQGLNTLIRLAQNNVDVLEPQIHTVCIILAKSIRNLRSQVARAACHAASEIFSSYKKGLDMEIEELAVPLLHRTADTNKFLRSDANLALDSMSLNLSIPRVVAVVTNKGSTHQNAVVRATSTRLLSDIVIRIGVDKVYQLPKETRDKFLLVGANGLTEGSLDIRRYAKSLINTLGRHQQFQKAIVEAVPQHTLRHITKIINSLK